MVTAFCLYKLSKTPKYRRHLIRTMLSNLILHQRIKTTHTKALALVRMAQKVVTMAKISNTGNKRVQKNLIRWVSSENIRQKLKLQIAPRFENSVCNFTRVSKLLGRRKGDKVALRYVEYKGNPKQIEQKRIKEQLQNKGRIKDPLQYPKKLLKQQLQFYKSKIQQTQNSDNPQKQKLIQFLKTKLKIVQHDIQNIHLPKFTKTIPLRL